MGRITDLTAVQFRMLNRSKGAAMWSPRAQCDKSRFSAEWRRTLENTPTSIFGRTLRSNCSSGSGLRRRVGRKCAGFGHRWGGVLGRLCDPDCRDVSGGVMYCGRSHAEGGRAGDSASHGVTESLVAMGFEAGRMKTGTLHDSMRGRSISKFWNRNTGMKIPRNFPFPPIRIRCRISFRAFWSILRRRCMTFCGRVSAIRRFSTVRSGDRSPLLPEYRGQAQHIRR